MKELLTTIREIQEGGKYLANHYLSHGYVLLDIQEGARVGNFPDADAKGHQYRYYVRRNPVYVLGRPEGVEVAEQPGPPPWSRRSDDGTGESP
jgi:hypothetical protein